MLPVMIYSSEAENTFNRGFYCFPSDRCNNKQNHWRVLVPANVFKIRLNYLKIKQKQSKW